MPIPDGAAQGLMLAATIARDRGGVRAETGIAPATRDRWLARARALGALDRSARAASLQRVSHQRPLSEANVPADNPRAACLLATRATPALGRRLLARGPFPRPGFVAEPGLLQLLLRIAQAGGEATAESVSEAGQDATGQDAAGGGDRWDG